jgi:hypothetical protein
MSFLVDIVLRSRVAVVLTVACLVHDGKMPVLRINNAATMVIFFMINLVILISVYVGLVCGANIFTNTYRAL